MCGYICCLSGKILKNLSGSDNDSDFTVTCHEKQCFMECRKSQDLDQPVHTRSLIKVSSQPFLQTSTFVDFLRIQERLSSNCAVAQPDLGIPCMHM